MDKRQINLAVFRHLKEKPDEERWNSLAETAYLMGKKVREFYLDQCRHVWDFDVAGYVIWGDDRTNPPTFARNDRKAYIEEYGLQGYEPTHNMIWGGTANNICGQAGLNTSEGVTYAGAQCGTHTMAHELGHMLGLHHSNSLNADGSNNEYGDGTTMMGKTWYQFKGFNSPQRVYFKWDDESTIVRPKETGQYLLCPIEMSKHSMHEEEVKHVILEVDGFDDYYLSIRKGPGGYHYSGAKPEYLQINSVTKRNQSIIHSSLAAGEEVVLPNGVLVQFEEYNDETARVNVIFEDTLIEDRAMPVGFPQHMPVVELAPKHSGSWGNKYFNGQGIYLQVNDDKMVMYWYTFNLKNNSRRFYFGTAELGEGLEEFDIYTTDGGTWENPEKATEIVVGKGQIFFFDDTHGVFNYNINEKDWPGYDKHGRGSMEITPVALAEESANSGVYASPSRDKEGFTIQFYRNKELCVAFWYTYGPRPYGHPNQTRDKQRWYVCFGTRNLDGTYDMEILEILDGKWMYIKEEENETPCGKAHLRIIDDSHIDFTFDIDADNGVKGTGTYNLEKLF